MTYELGDDTADASTAGERELALLKNLWATLLVGVFHRDDDLSLGGVGNEIHGTTETLDLAGKHPCRLLVLAGFSEQGN